MIHHDSNRGDDELKIILILVFTLFLLIPITTADITHIGEIHGAGAPNYLNKANSIEKSGDYVFIASNDDNALSSFDVSNPSNPIHLDTITTNLALPYDVSINGNYAYVVSYAVSADSFSVFDISNPSAMSHVITLSGHTAPNYIEGPSSVHAVGNYLYVANTRGRSLTIYDISNPAATHFVGMISGGGAPNYLDQPIDITVVGNYAYLSVYDDFAYTVIDVSTPSSPTYEASYFSTTHMRVTISKGMISGDYAFVPVTALDRLTILDISNPSAPAYQGSITGSGSPNYLNGIANLYVLEDFLYTTAITDNALTIFNISNITSPVNIGSVTGTGAPNYLDGASGVVVDSDYIYVVSRDDDALTIFEYTPPIPPTPTPTSTPIPTVTPVVAPPPISTSVPTPAIPIPPQEKITIIEELMTFLITPLSWIFILFSYLGALIGKLISNSNEGDITELIADIALYGTIGWILILLINFFIPLITINEMFSIIIFFISGFVVAMVLSTTEQTGFKNGK